MFSSLKKMRGDKKGWYKVSDLRPGVEIAVPSKTGDILWDEIVSIKPVGCEQVYDIEVEGTHNFVGNGIFAHNTYVLKANTMLAVEGVVNAVSFVVPIGSATSATSTSALGSEIPPEVLTVDGLGVDLYKLATYNLAAVNMLASTTNAMDVRLTSLETRVEKLESGAVGTGSTTANIGTGLASALNSFGAFISQGFAQFGTLIADRFVAATNSAGQSSAGTVNILTGNTVAQVTNAYVKPSSKIFVTFNSQITGSWWVSDKADGSFRVVLSVAQASDVSFDYFLVQTEGQMATSTPNGVGGVAQSSGPDTTPPVITMLGANPMRLSIGSTFVEPGTSATDAVDGTITIVTFVNGVQQDATAATIDTSAQTTYIITYSATDAAGNSATATRSVIIGSTPPSADTTSPVVTLTGAAALQLTVGDTFTDLGATALDDIDGDITASIIETGTATTTAAGSYSLTYTATDTAGNIGSASRLVTVASSTPAI